MPIDNAASKRAIRLFGADRANWHLVDSIIGSQASAAIYSQKQSFSSPASISTST